MCFLCIRQGWSRPLTYIKKEVMMRRKNVLAGMISAMMYAAAAAMLASCIWTGTDPDENGGDEEPPIPMDEVLRVEDVLSGGFAGDTVWVRGFIVGGLRSDGSIDFECGDEVLATALVLADDAGCTEAENCLVLQLTKNVHKEALGLHDAASKSALLYKGLYAQGKVTTYKKLPALNNLCRYQLE